MAECGFSCCHCGQRFRACPGGAMCTACGDVYCKEEE